MKMNEEIRTLQYLIADLTKKTADASKEFDTGNIMLEDVEELRPTREMASNKENIDGRISTRCCNLCPNNSHAKTLPFPALICHARKQLDMIEVNYNLAMNLLTARLRIKC